MFYLALACHQLSQLVTIKGLPEYVTSYVHNKIDNDIGQLSEYLELQEDNAFLNILVEFHFLIQVPEQHMEIHMALHLGGVENGSFMEKMATL